MLDGLRSSAGSRASSRERLFKQIEGFGEYGFPESHAASFALLVYATRLAQGAPPGGVRLRAPERAADGVLRPASIVKDAQRHGVEVRPACVARSTWDSTLEPGAGERRALRLGLRLIRGMGRGVADAIVKARAGAPFASVDDSVRRAHLRKNDAEALAEAGALAAIVPARREALWRARAPREGGLFEGLPIEADEDVGLPALRPIEQLALDYGRVGLSIDDHPMKHLRADLARRGVRRAVELGRVAHGSSVVVAGLVIGRQRPGTASG